MTDPLDTVKDALIDAASDALRQAVDPESRPALLFHFTDLNGLIGIAQTKTLWASLATNLSDSSEVRYGIELTADLLTRGAVPGPAQFWHRVRHYLDPANSPPAARIRWHSFVVSFCGHAESAIHWLHYGRSGTGVAIGFDARSVVRVPFELVKVIYEPDPQRKFVQALLSAVQSALEAHQPGGSANQKHPLFATAAHIAAQAVWVATPRLKSPAFASEEEWRLLTYEVEGRNMAGVSGQVPLPTKFRTSGGRMIAHKECAYDALPLSKVILGAACPTDPDDYALTQLLPAVPLTRSQVPIRP